MSKVQLVLIDEQNDFTVKSGKLFVPGADQNVQRVASMIRRLSGKLSDIILTMDSHRQVDISHPMWWVGENGNQPDPFSIITVQDVESGKWRTFKKGAQQRSLEYLRALAATGRYPHMIWPPHCLIGSWGACINQETLDAVHYWERERFAMATMVTKGSNFWTEHFSAVQAEVPDPDDISTQLNTDLVRTIEEADLTLWAGEALSHCLANTFRDTVAAFADKSVVSKMVLLTDGSSAVQGCEKLGEDFIHDMTALGMRTAKTTEILL